MGGNTPFLENVQNHGAAGLWLWLKDYDWLWTNGGIWPYLYQHDSSNWLYHLGKRDGKPVFYDYSNKRIIIIQELIVHPPEY